MDMENQMCPVTQYFVLLFLKETFKSGSNVLVAFIWSEGWEKSYHGRRVSRKSDLSLDSINKSWPDDLIFKRVQANVHESKMSFKNRYSPLESESQTIP